MSSQFETKVLFNGTISFRNREAAARFLELVGNVVESSVGVFHGKASPATLSNDLSGVEELLHHFVDNVDDKDDGDLPLTRSSTADARGHIGRIQTLLRQPVDDDQRFQLAEQFKLLFENLVVLMQLSERQQSKGFVRNITITLDSLEQACKTTKRTAYLHNQNLKAALQVIVRGTQNRAEVAKDHLLKGDFEALQTQLTNEGNYFTGWMDAHQHDESVTETEKRTQSHALRDALHRLRMAVEVRITSSAEFGYKFLERQRFNRAVDALAAASRNRDKEQVVKAAREISEIVKEVPKDLDQEEQDRLKAEAAKLLKAAQANLKGEGGDIDTDGAKQSMDKLADQEQEIKGKPLYGTLPGAIQSMAALLKSREATQARPLKKTDGPTAQSGARAPEQPRAKEEVGNASAPGYGLVATMASTDRHK